MTAPEEPTEVVVEITINDHRDGPLYMIELDVYGQGETYDLSPGRWLNQDEALELVNGLQTKLVSALVAIVRGEDVRV